MMTCKTGSVSYDSQIFNGEIVKIKFRERINGNLMNCQLDTVVTLVDLVNDKPQFLTYSFGELGELSSISCSIGNIDDN